MVLGAVVGLLVLAVLGLYLAAAGDYSVPPTVADDPSIPHITLDGVTFHVEEFGDPANQTVIVMHGGPGADSRYLLPLQELADQYHVVFYDQRGTGLSPRVDPAELTAQSSIDDLDLLVGHYGEGQPVYLIGHSWGGMLAAGYIGQHPEKVSAVVMGEPGGLTDESIAEFMTLQQSVINAGFMLRLAPRYFEQFYVESIDDRARDDYFAAVTTSLWETAPGNPYLCPGVEEAPDYWRFSTDASQAILGSVTREDGSLDMSILNENLDRYIGKVLILTGECDTWIGADHQKRYHVPLFNDVELITIPDAGHNMITDNPSANLDAVRAYFAEIES
jgi:proline iminopeptidase